MIIVQEIFGLTRAYPPRTADSYAADGYLAVAPALFDRVRRDLVLGYSPPERGAGDAAIASRSTTAKAVLDIAAAAAMARHAGRVAVIGFCWGGTARLGCRQRAATRRRGLLLRRLASPSICPRCRPARRCCTSANRTTSIPPADIERIRRHFRRASTTSIPPATRFDNDDRPDHYDAEAAALARARTGAFLAQHVG